MTWTEVGTTADDGRVFVRPIPTADRCPHGDVTCPCQDPGDPCHYEGNTKVGIDLGRDAIAMVVAGPMVCPHPTPELTDYTGVLNVRNRTAAHCHVEGCGWTGANLNEVKCGLGRVAGAGILADRPFHHVQAKQGLDSIRGTIWWPCGLMRHACTVARP